eukprot:CAMPEP_0202909862 /NCGR_PEP_ID=MMETSP1392-20130828/50482_1 /ASSEMBLY_ACC=CAM_ASM_000868 /TAXON_ID=225041 /ORGANISM="Chlamydomonas chlamydogama, Strain SAG 11-48b" /LENGTH=47 /DNA_ID= /DNA_START= /DNA_END= /DNA_ORIENTATION=
MAMCHAWGALAVPHVAMCYAWGTLAVPHVTPPSAMHNTLQNMTYAAM